MNQAEVTQSASARQGLSLQEKRAFILTAVRQMTQHTFGFICSVIGTHEPKTGRHCGSALRCKLDGRRAIITAHHVIVEAQKAPLGLALSTGFGEQPFVVHGPVNSDPFADTAVYFLPDDYPCPDSSFWPSTCIDRSLENLSTDYLFLHGFPGKRSYSSQLLNGIVSQSLPYGAMQRLEPPPPNLQPFQFAIDYDPDGMVDETGVSQELVDPHGLSGSPVWRIGVSGRPSREWKPSDCLLVGIVTQWRQDEKILIATSTEQLPPSW